MLEFRGPDRASGSEGAGGRPVPVRGFAGALPVGRGGVAPEPASLVIGIGGRPVAPVAWDRSPPGTSVSRRAFMSPPASPGAWRPEVSGPPDARAPLSSDPCQSNPPNVARPCACGPRRVRSPNACQSVSSLIRPPGSTISRRPDSSDGSEPGPSSPTAGGWAGLGGVVGRGGTEARRASVLMHPRFLMSGPFGRARALVGVAGREDGRPGTHTRTEGPASRRGGDGGRTALRACASLYGLFLGEREPVHQAGGICPERPPTLR